MNRDLKYAKSDEPVYKLASLSLDYPDPINLITALGALVIGFTIGAVVILSIAILFMRIRKQRE